MLELDPIAPIALCPAPNGGWLVRQGSQTIAAYGSAAEMLADLGEALDPAFDEVATAKPDFRKWYCDRYSVPHYPCMDGERVDVTIARLAQALAEYVEEVNGIDP